MARHYKSHPEWMDDERGRKGISALLELMHDVLNELEQYDISEKR